MKSSTVTVLRTHLSVHLTLVLDAASISDDKLLAALGSRRRTEYARVAWAVGDVDDMIAASTVECQEDVRLDKLLERHNGRIFLRVRDQRLGLINALIKHTETSEHSDSLFTKGFKQALPPPVSERSGLILFWKCTALTVASAR